MATPLALTLTDTQAAVLAWRVAQLNAADLAATGKAGTHSIASVAQARLDGALTGDQSDYHAAGADFAATDTNAQAVAAALAVTDDATRNAYKAAIAADTLKLLGVTLT